MAEISAGGTHVLARTHDRTVRAWADNVSGELGLGTTVNSRVPVDDPGLHQRDHRVRRPDPQPGHHPQRGRPRRPCWSWGSNLVGELGTGTTGANQLTPNQNGLTGVTRVAAGGLFSIAVARNYDDNEVYGWGLNSNGQLGNGSTANSTTPVEATGSILPAYTREVTTGAGSVYLIKETSSHGTGSVGVVGAQSDNGLGLNGLLPAAKLQLGSAATNTIDQVLATAQPGTSSSTRSRPPPGRSSRSRSSTTRSCPPSPSGVIVVEAASNYEVNLDTVPADADPRLGRHHRGGGRRAGERRQPHSRVPDPGPGRPLELVLQRLRQPGRPAGPRRLRRLVGSERHSRWLEPVVDGHRSQQDVHGRIQRHVLGDADRGQRRRGDQHRPAAGYTLTPWQVRTLLKQTGTPQTGDLSHPIGPEPNLRRAIDQLPRRAVGEVAAGTGFALGVAGRRTVKAWGINGNGQLGDGTTTPRPSPITTTGLTGVSPLAGSLATGGNHSLAVKGDGTVWAWGLNANGQLGNNTTTSRSVPIQVPGLSKIVAVSAGDSFSVALGVNGRVWAWGLNTNGQLGDGTTTERRVPVPVTGLTDVAAISAGYAGRHVLAVKTNGTVWAWGSNANGELGDNSTTRRSAPVQVSGLTEVSTAWGAVSAGTTFSLAVKTDGTAPGVGLQRQWPAGQRHHHQQPRAGHGDRRDHRSAGGRRAGAQPPGPRRRDGRRLGIEPGGELGLGTTGTGVLSPTTVPGFSPASAIAGGGLASHAVKANRTVWGWGLNSSGQLGNGTTTNASSPVQATGT